MASEKKLQVCFTRPLKTSISRKGNPERLAQDGKGGSFRRAQIRVSETRDRNQEHVARLEKVFEEIDETPRGKTCDAIMGIIEEGQEVMKEFKGAPALDAGLLAAAQAVDTRDCSLRYAQDLGRRAWPG